MRPLVPQKLGLRILAVAVALLAGVATLDCLREPKKQFTAPLLIMGVEFYQEHLSELLPTRCKFQPSCSNYAKEALRKYGSLKGGIKCLWRIARCSPLSKKGGVDYP